MSFTDKFGDGFLLNYFTKTNPFGLVPVEDCEAQGGLRPPPPTIYISLHKERPTWDYAEALGSELSGLNYARAQLAPDSTSSPIRWYNAYDNGLTAQRETTNMVNIVFPPAVGSNWPSVVGWGMWRVASGGSARDYIAFSAENTPIIVTVGNRLTLLGGPAPPSAIGGIRLVWIKHSN